MNLKLASSNRAISKLTRIALIVVLVLVFAIMELTHVFAMETYKGNTGTEKNVSAFSNQFLTSTHLDKSK